VVAARGFVVVLDEADQALLVVGVGVQLAADRLGRVVCEAVV